MKQVCSEKGGSQKIENKLQQGTKSCQSLYIMHA